MSRISHFSYRMPDIEHSCAAQKRNLWTVVGSELSPFTLKMISYLNYLGVPFRVLYEQGNTLTNLNIQLKKIALVNGWSSLTWPEMDDKDVYPLVPFLFGPDKQAMYDSTAIAHWFDRYYQHAETTQSQRSLFPTRHDACLLWLQNLIEEFFDDWGLYLVHHNRWVTAVGDCDADVRLARELRSVVGPLQPLVARFFSARQVRRLPYLFSVAPNGVSWQGIPLHRQPPAHQDFPATHDLLNASFQRILTALEAIFSQRRYLFGGCYSLADAAVYGQLGMNLSDPAAARLIQQQAPATYAWLTRMADLDCTSDCTEACWFDDLQPLLDEIVRIYIPLMQQNEAAYEQCRHQGISEFNEAAFWKGKALYSGELNGTPFKSVVKSFQVKTWRNIKDDYQALDADQQQWLNEKLNVSSLESSGINSVTGGPE